MAGGSRLMEWSLAAGVWVESRAGSPPNDQETENVDPDDICAVRRHCSEHRRYGIGCDQETKVPRSGPQAQAIAPRTAPLFNPYSPAATGGGTPGYNQMLERY